MDTHQQVLRAELDWLRLVVAAEIVRSSQTELLPLRLPADTRQRLLTQLTGGPGEAVDAGTLADQAATLREAIAARADGAVARLCTAFTLDDRDRQLLVLAAAPDLDSRFGYLYGVVLGDPARRSASAELATRLLATDEDDEWELRERLDPSGRLVRTGLLQVQPSGPFPFCPLRVPASVVHLLATGRATLDPALAGCAWLTARGDEPHPAVLDRATTNRLRRCAALWAAGATDRMPTLLLDAPHGAPVEAALATLATLAGRPMIAVDPASATAGTPPEEIIDLVRRDALAAGAILVVTWPASTPAADPATGRWSGALDHLLAHPGIPVIVTFRDCPPPLRPPLAARITLSPTTTGQRARLWRDALRGSRLHATDATVRDVASTFLLDPGQIRAAVLDADLARRIHAVPATAAALRAAAAARSAHDLDTVARRLVPSATWDDLVVPAATLLQLHELAAAARSRRLVLDGWGLRRRVRARGITALFHGRSGTGKTTAAEVLAADLGVDLYAVDLASIVSKWIGETEKNLRRVFDAARTANAVLLFDEADALFGRRSEVRDAHDRYANTEIAYLLQLMDGFDGVAVLSSNLTANMDPAFSRRLRYAVEFPVPDAELRERLWRLALPATVPADGVDLGFAAQRFDLTGGDIRNAALHAASLAAADGGIVTMPLLMIGVAREYQKQHRVPASDAFGPWYAAMSTHLRGVPTGAQS